MIRGEFYERLVAALADEIGLEPEWAPARDPTPSAAKPGQLVILEALPELDEPALRRTLGELRDAQASIVAIIPLRYANDLLPDGTNRHRTVENETWWSALMREFFPHATLLPNADSNDAIITSLPLSDVALRRLADIGKGRKFWKEVSRLKLRLAIARRQGSTLRLTDLDQEVQGRRVSVVGNARSLGDTLHGDAIDANDVVVRFNRAPIISIASHGRRTDWLATGVPVAPELLSRRGVRTLLWMSPLRRKMAPEMLRFPRLYLNPRSDWAALSARAGVVRPTTGLMILDLLARTRCAQVELFGFDFYKSQSFSGHQTLSDAPHDYEREEAIVAELLAADSRFRLVR